MQNESQNEQEKRREQKQNANDPLAIANYFIMRARDKGESLSILQLVKLVYLAHGWSLGFGHGPLIRSTVQAWQHGPVVSEVYNAFRPAGVYNINRLVADDEGNPRLPQWKSEAQKADADLVFDRYVKLHPYTLSDLTHARGTPWAMTDPRKYREPIYDEDIEEYYKKRASGE